ncbi:bromodomain-containing factor 1-like [Papaver somniferum]|uniref:bromodomain-containing factor 1-like n=1 Tax=Papaver somniferum TaxID=3469 RepID=UPI000E6F736A|nr:bromodomain-containing factor 1-like [Papaver somniferum]XP_026455508.1 bromodomain-containing factor 1-like [Papaver somniferum]
MKRKRGHKKGKHRKKAAVDVEGIPVLYDVDVQFEDDNDNDNDDDSDSDLGGAQLDSKMEVAVPAPVVPYQPPAFTKPTPNIITYKSGGRHGIGPVKVRLKSSKVIKPQESSPDMLDKSDTDKSSQHVSLEKLGEVERTDDSGSSLPEMQSVVVMEKVPSKSGTLKIKSFRGSSSVNTIVNVAGSPAQVQGVKSTQTASDNDKKVEPSVLREPKFHLQESVYSEQELNTSLMVIRKIMNMDAAEPFSVPVDPDALGIPDYFDIIHYPMDFGTICKNLEHGNKYKNSKDVFMDVQYIWENCYKYNNKGDYIVDLMRRVKKNFMKYWVAAGLYTERSQRANGSSESMQGENAAHSVKGTPSKQARKRHGMRQHKSDCLCAVCVMKRKRRERDAQLIENQIEISDGNLSQDPKQEETAGTPFSEDTSSNLESYPVAGADIDMEEQAQKMKLESQEVSDNDVQNQNKDEGEPSEALQTGGDASGEEGNLESRFQEMDASRFATESGSQKNNLPLHQGEPTTAEKLQHKQEELRKRNQQIEIYKKFFGGENPMLTELCGNLFSGDPRSVWSGPHSLVPRHVSLRSSRGIHAALSTFMK